MIIYSTSTCPTTKWSWTTMKTTDTAVGLETCHVLSPWCIFFCFSYFKVFLNRLSTTSLQQQKDQKSPNDVVWASTHSMTAKTAAGAGRYETWCVSSPAHGTALLLPHNKYIIIIWWSPQQEGFLITFHSFSVNLFGLNYFYYLFICLGLDFLITNLPYT